MAVKTRAGLIATRHAWGIALGPTHRETLLHTNWLLGHDPARKIPEPRAWPGMFQVALFETRKAARDTLKRLRPVLPFPAHVEAVELTWMVSPAKLRRPNAAD